MMTAKTSKSFERARGYCEAVVGGKLEAPKYVKLQCEDFLKVCSGKSEKYTIDMRRGRVIDQLTKLMIMPKGLAAGKSVYECTADFQWFFYFTPLCVVYKNERLRRRYESVILEIARKNGKTFMIAVVFILLFFLEPRFSRFFSVAPDGKLSKELHGSIREIVRASPALRDAFKLKRDEIVCPVTDNVYTPLAYSNDRLDGKLPNVFLIDEAGALPSTYAIEAMRSGQLTIRNKLGCVISTKYPREENPFEEEVAYAKRVLDGTEKDETLFALLFEPDSPKGWETDTAILKQANPLSLTVPEVYDDLLKKRRRAITMRSARENFLCKHCNILYQGSATETYVAIDDLRRGRVDAIDWQGRRTFLGIDLAMTEDNCAAVFISESADGGLDVLPIGYLPEDRIAEKSAAEKLDYRRLIEEGCCYPCGDRIVNYNFIEEHIRKTAREREMDIVGFGFDRWNCISTANKFENPTDGYEPWIGTIVEQKSYVLSPAVKYVAELVAEGKLHFADNRMFVINFANARCTYDTNLNRYISKKKSNGKIDMVAALLNAVFVYLQDKNENETWGAQI